MIKFTNTIELDNDCAHWYIDLALENGITEYDFFEMVLTNYYLEHIEGK